MTKQTTPPVSVQAERQEEHSESPAPHEFLAQPRGKFPRPENDNGKCWEVVNMLYCGLPRSASVHQTPAVPEHIGITPNGRPYDRRDVAEIIDEELEKSKAVRVPAAQEDVLARYQACFLRIWKLFESDPLPVDDPAHFYIERLESTLDHGLLALMAQGDVVDREALTEPERNNLRRAIAESEIAGCELHNKDIDDLVGLFESWLERNANWRDGATAPKDGTAFRAYSPELVHPDFNPWGSVEAVFDGDKFIGAVWDGQFDCWNTVEITPRLWQPLTGPNTPAAQVVDRAAVLEEAAQVAYETCGSLKGLANQVRNRIRALSTTPPAEKEAQ